MLSYPRLRKWKEQTEEANAAVLVAQAAAEAAQSAADDAQLAADDLAPLVTTANNAAIAAQTAADNAQASADTLDPLVTAAQSAAAAAQAAADAASTSAEPLNVVSNMANVAIILDGPNSTYKRLDDTIGTDVFGSSWGSHNNSVNTMNQWRGISKDVPARLIKDGKVKVKWTMSTTSSSYTQARIQKNGVNVWYSGSSCATMTRYDEIDVVAGDTISVQYMCETNSGYGSISGAWWCGTLTDVDLSPDSVL